jgi:lipopolysaccharide biosynthesis protein
MSLMLRGLRHRRPSVLDAQAGAVIVEGPDAFGEANGLDRVAVVAHWAPDARIDRSTAELVAAIARNGFRVLLVSTAPSPGPLVGFLPGARPSVLRRPNVGYDFGSWATALDRYPSIADAPEVLFMNTSMAGPFAPIDPLIGQFERSRADIWSLTDSTQVAPHPQSYCLGFRGRCLREGPLDRFWRDIRVERSREAVIDRYEIGLGRLLQRERYVVDAAIRWWRVVSEGENPTVIGWRSLLDQGFPFVKRQVIREPSVAPDGAAASEEIRRRFGVTVAEWL